MSRIQNGKNRNPEKPISGCLGRMVTNLFDLNTTIGGGNNKRLTDKPHHETTPIKTLIAQEMSKEDDCKQSPSNLVAKLMGLDALPPQHHQQPVSPPFRHHSRHSRSHSESLLELSHQSRHEITEECKDVYEIWQQHGNNNNNNYSNNNNKMALIREKFMEAKRLSTDEKLRQSKQFQDALEVLSSNKDLFLKFLQEPDSLFSQHLYNLQSLPPPPDSRRITVLRPSKLVDNQNQSQSQSQKKNKTSSDFIFSPESCKLDENPSQPTRIVILKPHSNNNIKVVDGLHDSHDDVFDEVLESRKVDETTTLVSSVFSNGYIGDDSSFCKSEIENLSDSEAVSVSVSPTSRHSWDYINRFNSHYATSSSHASYSQESSVCREAKKRLSERWAIMASNKNVVEQKQIQRSSSTLGDMLALSDLKKTEEKESEIKEESRNDENTPGNLPRSRSVPASSGSFEDDDVDERKERLVKSSSFKGRVSSLFFSKNKKSSGKEKSTQSTDVRVPQSATTSSRNEGSLCLNDMIVEEESCSRLYRRSQGVILPEAGFSFKNNHSENQEQPSPISVLEPQFEEYDHTTNRHPNLGVDPMKYNLIGKSPPIGSISRTLSWDDSSTLKSSTPYTCKPSSSSSSAPLNPQQEQQECFFYVQTLLSVSGLSTIHTDSLFASWHSPESPLDPSLRDTYTNLTTEHSSSLLSQKRVYESLTRLVFDCVNEALIDIGSGAHMRVMMTSSSVLIEECVWARVKEWLYSGEERWGWGEWEEGGGAVEEVVRKEVVGRGWVEGVRLESDDVRKEIEGKLLEEIVEEFVFELTNRAS
ncbi:hypothetical protein LXL04_036804 [Taraxacum kok-saghyz]